MPVPGTPAALAQPRRHRAGPGHPTTVPAQPRSRHALPHAEPDPVMWPGRETEAAEGAGGCQRVLGLVVPGTPQMGLGEGGSRRKGLRGKRSRFPLITAKPQPAGRAGGAFRLGLKSTEGHTCDEHARSQHNRTDSAGGGGMWPGGGGHWWDREGGAARGASHPPPATLRPRGTDGNVPGRRKVSPASKRGQGGCGGARAPGGGHSGHGSSGLAGFWAGGRRWGPQGGAAGKGRGSPAPLSGTPQPCPSPRLRKGGGCTPPAPPSVGAQLHPDT